MAALAQVRGNLSHAQAGEVVGVPAATWRRWEFGQQQAPRYVLRHFARCAREMFCGYKA